MAVNRSCIPDDEAEDIDRVISWLRSAIRRAPCQEATKWDRALDSMLSNDLKQAQRDLGLIPKPGQRSYAAVLDTERRNRAIRALSDKFDLRPKEIALLMCRYGGNGWKRDRLSETCPDRLIGKPEAYVWRALKARDLPLSERQIARIINPLDQT